MRLLALIVALTSSAVYSQDQQISLNRPGGQASAALRVPAAAKRPPLACLLSPEATGLAVALAAEGVASVVLDPKTDVETAAQWIAQLRNDERFPTLTVFGEGAALLTAVIAARAARADGLITRGDTTAASAELGRVVAKVGTAPGKSAEDDAKKIAEFAKSVTAFGRRGSPTATRPSTARRSPRQVMIAMVGTTRVAIEWGAPQKRGREIWGELVKWGEVWSPGSDEAATITTDGPLTVGSLQLPAGDHTFFAMPAADKFELIISKDVGQFHTQHDESKYLGRVEMTLKTRDDVVEGLTYAIEGGSTLKLIWDKREYSVAIGGPKVPGSHGP